MPLYSGFQPNSEVAIPDFLFDHNRPGKLLDKLERQLLLGANIQLLGERRSGKTSILKCLAFKFKENNPGFVPVYINYREHPSIKGHGAAYKFLLASIHASVVKEEILKDVNSFLIRDFEFDRNGTRETVYEALAPVADYKIGGLIEDYMRFLSGYRVGVVLLIDEYEHLMRNTFEGNGGAFFHIRSLSSKPSVNEKTPKPLTYVIAGVLPWDQLCTLMGSPELNNTGPILFVEPLDFDSFLAMWNHCLTASSTDFQSQVEENAFDINILYKIVGGWAFYAKLAGQYLGSTVYNEDELYDSLMQHFNVIWSHLDAKERELLLYANFESPLVSNSQVRALIQRGLIEVSSTGLPRPRGSLWARYVLSRKEDLSLQQQYSNPKSEMEGNLTLLSDEIAVLITEINETSMNLHNGEVFKCSNQDVQTYHDLRRVCVNADEFSHFALSLYNLIFERTNKEKNVKVVSSNGSSIQEKMQFRALETLPDQFRRKNLTVRIVDSVRHHFGKGHLTRLESFNASGSGLDIGEVLQRYLHAKAHPSENQLIILQMGILNDVKDYLIALREHLQAEALETQDK